MKLALFDLDHTLLNIDSDHAWGEFLIQHNLVDTVRHKKMNDQFYQDYQEGQLDSIAYNEFVFEFLVENDQNTLAEYHQQFMENVIRPQLRPKGFEAVQYHQALGHEILGITATNDFITTPIFHAFGVTNVIATTAEQVDGKYTGKVLGTPSFQNGKLIRLDEWLDGRTVEESWAYSDSYNDRFLLDYASHATAVNPDERLQQLATSKGWDIVDWSI